MWNLYEVQYRQNEVGFVSGVRCKCDVFQTDNMNVFEVIENEQNIFYIAVYRILFMQFLILTYKY